MNYQKINSFSNNKLNQGSNGRRYGNRKESPEVILSKNLSKVLRHSAVKMRIPIDSEGYVEINELKKLNMFKSVSFEEIQKVVENNDKKRFTLKNVDNIWYIKANQGHSIELKDNNLKKITDPSEIPVVVHGTYRKFLPNILKIGLIPGTRTHIHFAKGLYGSKDVISGMRYNYEIAIYIDAEKAMKDGINFFISENGVILSRGLNGSILPKYFSKICDRNGREI